MPNEDGELTIDISTQEATKKSMHDIVDAYKSLKAKGVEREADLANQMDTLKADLVNVQRELTETKASHITALGNSNDEFKTFTDADNKSGLAPNGIVWAGGLSSDKVWHKGLLDAQEPRNEWHRGLLELVQQRTYIRNIRKGKYPGQPGNSEITDRQLQNHLENAPPSISKFFGDSANIGAEWIPDQHLPMLEMDLRDARRVEALFQSFDMPEKELKLPFLTNGLTPYLKGVHTADDPGQYRSSSLVTDKIDLTAIGMAVRSQVDEDASEDSIIPTLPLFNSELVAAITDGTEDAIINGDTAATHQDDLADPWNPRSRFPGVTGGTDDHRRAWLGMRALAFDRSATIDGTAAQTYAGFLAALAAQASPHGAQGDQIMLTSPEYFFKILGFAEVLTLDKFGPNASILTGQIASLGGKPVVQTELLTADLAATGLYTGTGATSSYITVNRSRYKMGNRRGTMVETDKDITRGLWNFVATRRSLFFDLDSPTSKKNLTLVFNVG